MSKLPKIFHFPVVLNEIVYVDHPIYGWLRRSLREKDGKFYIKFAKRYLALEGLNCYTPEEYNDIRKKRVFLKK